VPSSARAAVMHAGTRPNIHKARRGDNRGTSEQIRDRGRIILHSNG
jgi:hypothetical protein